VEQSLELIGRRLVAGQVLLECGVVEFDDVLHQVLVLDAFGVGELVGDRGLLCVSGVVDERMMGEHIGDTVEARLLADRQLGRVGMGTEHLAYLRERAVERRPLAVELVDEHESRDVHRRREPPQRAVLRLYAGDAVDHEHREVRSCECQHRLAAEVGVSRRVDQIDAVAVPVERRHRE
jgi:hypothetical protein